MRLDHAAYVRSGMDDMHVIQLWRDGATLEDLKAFSERVQHACPAARIAHPTRQFMALLA
jgi:hypothetical protein